MLVELYHKISLLRLLLTSQVTENATASMLDLPGIGNLAFEKE
jgi:hypothetical protein